MRLPARFVKHRGPRRGRGVVLALVFLTGGTAADALPLAPEASSAAGERARELALASAHLSAETARTGAQVGLRAVRRPQHRRGGQAHYRRISSRHVPAAAKAGFLPLYREAARTFGVSWRLIASIHRQETAFSTAPGTYHGLNAYGCCAGPMQFNVKNGPPSTWKLYRNSFRLGDRPRRYPHRTRSHPSIYDDFDAIMAAGALLRDAGAGEELDGAAWSAAYAYYGHDLFGIGYASQVLGRALGWEIDGFCLNCPLNDTLVAAFDAAHGRDARRQLLAAERRAKHDKRKRKAQRSKASKNARQKTKRRKADRSSARDGTRTTPAPKPRESPPSPGPETTTTPPPATTETAPQPATPPPAAENCTVLSRLLGCGS